jgi:hypothetical protein
MATKQEKGSFITPHRTDSIPFLFQYEYFNIAWGLEHEGFYLLPDGRKYSYNASEENNYNKDFRFYKIPNQKNDIVWGDDTNGFIRPDDLFHNFSISTLEATNILELDPNETLKKIKDVQDTEGFYWGLSGTDSGVSSLAALYFNEKAGYYERVLLATDSLINHSKYTPELYNIFGSSVIKQVFWSGYMDAFHKNLPPVGLNVRTNRGLKSLLRKMYLKFRT